MADHEGDGPLPTLGGADDVIRCDSPAAIDRFAQALLVQARRSVAVSSPVYDLPAFNTEQTSQGLASLVAASRRNQVRLLLEDEQDFLRRNPRLVELCRSLPSFIQVRVLPREYGPLEELMIVADATGFLLRREAGGSHAGASMNAPARSRRLLREFDHRWERAERSRELTVTGLK